MGSRADKRPWLAEGEDKRAFVRGMFSDIAPTYDLLNSLMSFRLHRKWRTIAVDGLQLKPGDAALDVCCGTGDFLPVLRRAVGQKGRVVGIDFAGPMLDRARGKTRSGLCLGDACALPVCGASFDSYSVGWGLRNVPSVERALAEAVRVLKPGGRFTSVDMARPKGLAGAVSERVFHTAVPVLGRLFGRTSAYTYLPKSTTVFLEPDAMDDAMRAAGLTDIRHRRLFFGNICVHWGTRP
ncbi:MAG: ubiquinone/menaquinone biosynthesis methyltransferase [Armatimonadetes bacterium]|nr:ubiquinone/menaquinone biosynthesis methyltransferase [Armatimonadota bacterium]